MRTALVLAGILAIVAGEGHYHQEYNYKTSSSSYRNNELQHQTDDQGYYSKDGDLEGRVRPKVKANSEHSEYVNPNSRAGYYDANSDLTSHGNLLANSYGASVGGQVASGYHSGGSRLDTGIESEGLASSNYIGGYANSAYNAHSAGSAYETSNLRSVVSRLQNDLQQELQSAVRQSHLSDIAVLEEELRRNLTARLQDILQQRYGVQTIKGGMSYSLSDGRLQASPNYDQRELEQLQRQIERSLLDELRQEYRTSQSHQSYNQQQHYERYQESTTTYRPYTTSRPIYPNLNVVAPEVRYPSYGNVAQDSQYRYTSNSQQRYSTGSEYVQVPNAVSITTIASNVQRDLNNRLNQILQDAQRQYFTENARYDAVNTGSILDRLRQDLRQNISYTLEEELRRHFGNQFERNGYMFSTGQTNQYNYNAMDLENLRRQVEDNLITKLNRDFEAAKQQWVTRQQQQQQHLSTQQQHTYYGQSQDYSHQSAGDTQRYQYSTPRYQDDYYRPTAASIVPLIGQGIKGGHQYQAGSSVNAYESRESSNMVQLQNQLQHALSNQLQAALSQNRAHLSRYSADNGQAAFDEAYRRLYDELQRNLTAQLQTFTAGSSGGYSNSYGSFNDNQMAQLKSQLQNSLASQLQQGLQQSYSASASYSASSGSSASAGSGAYSGSSAGTGGYYRAARGSESQQFSQYAAGGAAGYAMEECAGQGEDPYRHQYHRMKRSYGYRSRPLGLATNTGAAYGARDSGYGSSAYGQHVDDDLVQSYYDPSASSRYRTPGQHVDDTELIQPNNHGGYSASTNYGRHHEVGQEIDDTDETQQVEVDPLSDSARSQQSMNGHQTGQVEDDSDTQQVQLNPGLDWNGQTSVGQVEDDSDDTQQVLVDHGFNNLDLGSHNLQQSGTQTKPVGQFTSQGALHSSGSQNGGYAYHAVSQVRPGGNELSPETQSGYQPEEVHHSYTSGGSLYLQSGANQVQNNLQRPRGQVAQAGQSEDVQHSYTSGGSLYPQSGANQVQNNLQRPRGQVAQEGQSEDVQHSYTSGGSHYPRPGVDQVQYMQNNRRPLGQVAESQLRPLSQSGDAQRSDGTQTAASGQYSATGGNVQYLENSRRPTGQGYQPGDGANQPNSWGTQGRRTYADVATQTGYNSKIQGQVEDEVPVYTGGSRRPSGQGYQVTESQLREQSNSGVPRTYADVAAQTGPELGASYNSQIAQGQLEDNSEDVPIYTGVNAVPQLSDSQLAESERRNTIKPAPGQVVDDSDDTQQVEDAFTSLFGGNQQKPDADTKREVSNNESVSNQPSRHRSHPRRPATDIEDTQQVLDQTHYEIGEPTYLLPDGSPSSSLRPEVGNQLGQEVDDFDTIEHIGDSATKPSTTTTINPLLLQSGVESVSPQSGIVRPFDTTQSSTVAVPQQRGDSLQPELNSFATSNTNNNNLPETEEEAFAKISPQLKPLSKQIKTNLLQQLEESLLIESSSTATADQIYREKLYSLKVNITNECDKIRRNSYFLSVQQSDVTVLQNYLEIYLVQKLNQKFVKTSTGEVVAFKPALARPMLVNPYRPSPTPNPQVSSNDFLNRETGYSGAFVPPQVYNTRPYQTGSLVTPATPKTVTDPVSGLPLPTLKPQLAQAESEADLLLQNLRNSLQNRPSSPRPDPNPEYQVIQVKLENVTPEQFSIINQIEQEFSTVLDVAIQNDFAYKSFDHSTRYVLYQSSLNKLEQELKRNLTQCFEGTLSQDSQLQYLNKYSSQVYSSFDYQKISDVKKYIEIKLIKKLRAQLKVVYNIDSTNVSRAVDATNSAAVAGHSPNAVRLENLTPEQARVIKHIEDDINKQIEAAIESHIASLRDSQKSEYYIHYSLETLEEQLKNNITESIQRLCEPGFSQYPELLASNFDMGKINDLEKYLQIRLLGKLKENIKYYSRTTSSTSYYSSSRHYSSSSSSNSYNSYHRQPSNGYQTGQSDNGEVEVLAPGAPLVPVPSPGHRQPSNGYQGGQPAPDNSEVEVLAPGAPVVPVPSPGSVKGGRPQAAYRDSLGANPSVVGQETSSSSSSTIDPEVTEPVTEAQGWWTRFGNKVKQGASKLKEKITGKSSEPATE